MTTTPPNNSAGPTSDFGWNLNQTLNQLLSFNDAKLPALLTADVAIVVLLLSNKPSFPPHPFASTILKSLADFLVVASPFTYVLALLCFVFSIGIALFAFASPAAGEDEKNVVFWHWIEQQPLSKYQKAVKDLNDPSVHEAYAMENHRLSKELNAKFCSCGERSRLDYRSCFCSTEYRAFLLSKVASNCSDRAA